MATDIDQDRRKAINRAKQARHRDRKREAGKALLLTWVDVSLLSWEWEQAKSLGLTQAEHIESILRAEQARACGLTHAPEH